MIFLLISTQNLTMSCTLMIACMIRYPAVPHGFLNFLLFNVDQNNSPFEKKTFWTLFHRQVAPIVPLYCVLQLIDK